MELQDNPIRSERRKKKIQKLKARLPRSTERPLFGRHGTEGIRKRAVCEPSSGRWWAEERTEEDGRTRAASAKTWPVRGAVYNTVKRLCAVLNLMRRTRRDYCCGERARSSRRNIYGIKGRALARRLNIII